MNNVAGRGEWEIENAPKKQTGGTTTDYLQIITLEPGKPITGDN
ncbi:MAG: hypothetical protein NTX45_15045 [Proteobacteria bacterium]|nr:hypothetical protein [Pseudomonadota bacterium]